MYKQYALIQNGMVIQYPVDPRIWDSEKNEFNIHEYWEGGELDGKTYVFCHNFEPIFKYDEMLIEKNPIFSKEKNIWIRQYDIVKVDDKTLEERRKNYQFNAEQIVSNLTNDFESMKTIISELSEQEQQKWFIYQQNLLNICLEPEYPFVYKIPVRPDYEDNLKIKVTKI